MAIGRPDGCPNNLLNGISALVTEKPRLRAGRGAPSPPRSRYRDRVGMRCASLYGIPGECVSVQW